MNDKKTKVIATLGPATRTENDIRRLKYKGVDFVRVNMSHSSLKDLKYFMALAKKVGIPFIIDTEGSQIRTGELNQREVYFNEGAEIKIFLKKITGDDKKICLKPGAVIKELHEGDLIYVDFGTLIFRISDTSTLGKGYIVALAITGGALGRNKGVVVDSISNESLALPALTPKDYKSIAIGLKEGAGYIAASFMRSKEYVEEVRRATKNSMKIISKIECVDGLQNLDEIIKASDFLLIDRGDLSKEISIERIPFAQKMIMSRAKRAGRGVFVATNLLETMVREAKPTRAEVNDVINTILDGAAGLALAAETAIGKYPIQAANMLNVLIRHAESMALKPEFQNKDKHSNKIFSFEFSGVSGLVPPNGGKLIDRRLKIKPKDSYLKSLPKIKLSDELMMDVWQIATGAFSPLQGFMNKKELRSVLERMRLPDGTIYPMPIVLDVSHEEAEKILPKSTALLLDSKDSPLALIYVEDKFNFDKKEFARLMYGTLNTDHPGVKKVLEMKPIFVSGKIDFMGRPRSATSGLELTPRQVRRLFEERGWSRVVGFHTRNVIHKSHEFIQLAAVEGVSADGLFVHPVVGKKKKGDYNPEYIIKSYEMMAKDFYPKNSALFATFATYSRYAGPREALFTAICRQNFGCSHFVVGRDHTGVGNFYKPDASHKIFDEFPDLGIEPIKFNEVFYSKKYKRHVYAGDDDAPQDKLSISGTEARVMFQNGKIPPEWFMRKEISKMILAAIKRGEKVFVSES